jgi:glycosyltransferase involved in cell wall biosynthesis
LKKVLFVYPHNFLDRNMGTNNRVYSVAKYLKETGWIIDLFACTNLLSKYDDFTRMNDENIVRNLYLYNFKLTYRYKEYHLINRFFRKNKLENWVTPFMKKQFDYILSNDYDCVVMFYLYTATLLKNVENRRKIYFMEDFLSLGQCVLNQSKKLGVSLNDEISCLQYFDDVVCISHDEKIFFEKILPEKKFHFVPHLINEKKYDCSNKEYDVVFIGFNNGYNIAGMRFFFSEIYQGIKKDIKILIVGRIVETITEEYENVTKMDHIDDLSSLYPHVKVAICPLLNGTGMKIKVIEAMSYGIPIVCTSRGVDGFPDKNENGCLVTDEPGLFACYINRLINDSTFYNETSQKIRRYFNQYLSKNGYHSILQNIFSK